MKKRMKAVAMFAALVMGLSLIGCSDEDDDDGATGPDVEAALPETVGTDPFTSGLYTPSMWKENRWRIVFTENDRFRRGYSIAIDTSQRTITLFNNSNRKIHN
ncbi:MAG: hypothetical protein J1F61_06695, partial [Clostridiales bacterium]|nr:hypothetical protein [Clostridiales bacterium]